MLAIAHLSNPEIRGGQRFDERVEFGIGQGAVDVAIGLGLLAADVLRAQQHLQGALRPMSCGSLAIGPPPATMPTPTSHWERMAFSRLANHVAGEGDLAAVARRAAADEGDRDDRRAGQTHQEIGPRRQARRTGRYAVRSSIFAVKSE